MGKKVIYDYLHDGYSGQSWWQVNIIRHDTIPNKMNNCFSQCRTVLRLRMRVTLKPFERCGKKWTDDPSISLIQWIRVSEENKWWKAFAALSLTMDYEWRRVWEYGEYGAISGSRGVTGLLREENKKRTTQGILGMGKVEEDWVRLRLIVWHSGYSEQLRESDLWALGRFLSLHISSAV